MACRLRHAGSRLRLWWASGDSRTLRLGGVIGFVLGMTFVFGSVLPTMTALVAGTVSVLAHFAVFPVVAALYKRLRGTSSWGLVHPPRRTALRPGAATR